MTTAAALEKKKSNKRGRPRKNQHPGRPPPLDPPPPQFPHLPPVSRRSSRRPRRQLREDFYNVDEIVVDGEDDDYFQPEERDQQQGDGDDDEEEEEKDFRSKKKLKLLLKLPHHQIPTPPPNSVDKSAVRRRNRTSLDSPDVSCSDNDEIRHHVESSCRHLDRSDRSFPSGSESGTPLPDSKTLILTLDKIQKKDKYGVFSEPVDPEELPDYHEVIEHPMDFRTIRKKLAMNLYSNMEQFEGDVLLLCSNAMKYNAPETIYFKQASSMEELARRKFQMIRAGRKQSNGFLNIDELKKKNSTAEKPIENQPTSVADNSVKHQTSLVVDRPTEKQANLVPDNSMGNSSPRVQADSDFSPGVNATSNGNAKTEMKNREYVVSEKCDQDSGVVASISFICGALSQKPEGLPEKCIPPSQGLKPSLMDEDRRATYNMSNQQSQDQLESLFATIEGEKQLVAVGPNDEISYARSLARFSANLGPIAWRIASEKIQKVLPSGLEFGPGWVGDYEPPLFPIFSRGNYFLQVSSFTNNLWCRTVSRNNNHEALEVKHNSTTKNIHSGAGSNLQSSEVCNTVSAVKKVLNNGTTEGKQALFGVTLRHQSRHETEMSQQQKDKLKEYSIKVYANEKVKTDGPAKLMISNHADFTLQRPPNSSEAVASKFHSRNRSHVLSSSSNESEISALQTEHSSMKIGGLPAINNSKNARDGKLASSSFISSDQAIKASMSIPLSVINKKTDDPAKLLRVLPANVRNYQHSSLINEGKQVISPHMSSRKNFDIPSATSAPTWLPVKNSREHIPAEALNSLEVQTKSPSANKPSWMLPFSGSGFQEFDARPVSHSLSLRKSHQMSFEEHGVQNQNTVTFPQFFASDLSRFHSQTPWQGLLPHAPQRQNKGMLPPDLNIGFQAPGSPVQQTSGILVDSQQPDLALQL